MANRRRTGSLADQLLAVKEMIEIQLSILEEITGDVEDRDRIIETLAREKDDLTETMADLDHKIDMLVDECSALKAGKTL